MAVRVLIVDDLVAYRRVARAVVDASDGFEAVGEAASGEEAVLAACLLHPDLVLMDVNLPGIDGMEATRRIRAQPVSPVVVLLSTWDGVGSAWAEQCGAAQYIPKSRLDCDQLELAWRRVMLGSADVVLSDQVDAAFSVRSPRALEDHGRLP